MKDCAAAADVKLTNAYLAGRRCLLLQGEQAKLQDPSAGHAHSRASCLKRPDRRSTTSVTSPGPSPRACPGSVPAGIKSSPDGVSNTAGSTLHRPAQCPSAAASSSSCSGLGSAPGCCGGVRRACAQPAGSRRRAPATAMRRGSGPPPPPPGPRRPQRAAASGPGAAMPGAASARRTMMSLTSSCLQASTHLASCFPWSHGC
mmetsp:Transcript_16040/g.48511  ORF Transcript_16040/g.48511 Transcript_16040/m.48511 type:complete len:202 (+) Transcript_16040:341-946(+)